MSGSVLENDADPDQDPLRAMLISDVEHGTLTLNDGGTFTYIPQHNFTGLDKFTYRASDGASSSEPATVTLIVQPVNDAPEAQDDSAYTMDEDSSLSGPAAQGVLANDSDPDGDPLTAVLVTGPDHGTLQLRPDGSFDYSPSADYFGIDRFTYAVDDGLSRSNTATVTVTVRNVPDAPRAVDDVYAIDEDRQLAAEVVRVPLQGLIHHWAFDEASGGTAADSVSGNDGQLFNWRASENKWVDGRMGGALNFGDADNYVKTQTVIPSEQYTIAYWSRLNVREGTNPRIISPAGSDWIIQNNEFGLGMGFYRGNSIVQAPTEPVLGVWEHYAVTLDLPARFARVYQNGVEVASGAVARDVPRDHWIMGHNQDPGNHGDSWNGLVDERRVYSRLLDPDEIRSLASTPGVLANDVDPDGDAVQAILLSDVTHGQLEWNPDGRFIYQPPKDFFGTDSFTYQLSDGSHLSAPATVTIMVRPVNATPVANEDIYSYSGEGTLTVGSVEGVLANDGDEENDPLTAQVVDQPSYGDLQLDSDGSFIYTAGPAFHLVDSFTYQVSDGNSTTDPVTVRIERDAPRIVVGDHTLIGDTPGQLIQVFVTGGHNVKGLDLYVQVGDGGPERTSLGLSAGTDGPAITGVDLKSDTIFAAVPDQPTDLGSLPQVANLSLAVLSAEQVWADGLLVTLTMDTTGLYEGTWDLMLGGVLPDHPFGPFDTTFAGTPVHIANGTISIQPAEVRGRHIFYNNSSWDAKDPGAGPEDDQAIAPDKSGLLPGETASFANYTSYSRGINGVMIDITGMRGGRVPSADDFEFRVGRSGDPTTWQAAPLSQISVRQAAGVDGSDRITLIWPDNAIQQQWLEVRVKSSSTTLLPRDDVFYFGNAIGEVGNAANNTLVTSIDVLAARDHQRGPFDLAPITDVYDFNRDRLFSSIDVITAGDNQVGFLNALPLITPAADSVAPAAALAVARDAESLEETARSLSTVSDRALGPSCAGLPGDANRDGYFDTDDLVQVFQAGEYEDGIDGNSYWREGDFNCDGDFSSADLVLAFRTGAYRSAATDRRNESAVGNAGTLRDSWAVETSLLLHRDGGDTAGWADRAVPTSAEGYGIGSRSRKPVELHLRDAIFALADDDVIWPLAALDLEGIGEAAGAASEL